MMDLQAQQRMFGCDLSVLECAVAAEFEQRHPSEVVTSMLSDIQEMLDRTSCEPTARDQIRQRLNRVKWVVCTYLHPEEATA